MNRLPILDPTPTDIGLVVGSFAALVNCKYVHCIDARVKQMPLHPFVDLVVHYDTRVMNFRYRSFEISSPWNGAVDHVLYEAINKHDADTNTQSDFPIDWPLLCRSISKETT